MKDFWNVERGRCSMDGCNCEVYIRQVKGYDCGRCGHPPKTHIQIASARSTSGLDKPKSKVPRQFAVHFQTESGRKLLINGLAVHLITPSDPTALSLLAACCNKAKTLTGRLLTGPSGPELPPGAQLTKQTMYFRSNQDMNTDEDSDLEDVLNAGARSSKFKKKLVLHPPAKRSLPQPDDCIVVSIARPETSMAGSAVPAVRSSAGARGTPMPRPSGTSLLRPRGTPMPRPSGTSLLRPRGMSVLESSRPEDCTVDRWVNRRLRQISDNEAMVATTCSPKPEVKPDGGEDIIKLDNVMLENEIGDGGEGTVFRGQWLDSPVAIKVFRGEYFEQARTECVNLRKLSHPNVVQFFGLCTLERKVGMVIELCDFDLSSFCHTEPPPKKSILLHYVSDALRGLVYVHDKGFVHMDVKPSNILVQEFTELLSCTKAACLLHQQLTCAVWVSRCLKL